MSDSCVVSDLLDSNNEAKRLVKLSAAGIYSGSIETTAADIETFLAMVLQPDAQRKAQNELEVVLGYSTVPRLVDRPRLPSTEALTGISEIFRMYPIGPVGLPHVTAEDDTQNGFSIPTDSIILTNNGWVLCAGYRPTVQLPTSQGYFTVTVKRTLPEIFRSERVVETATTIPKRRIPGRRRACPGVHLAM
ncbi:hypothetical protein DFH07DRAFT_587249 [Mycena maculata]|uniref:Uncharacterized protein n=1 Tax=Mycena maculata TaxID=230809 RepID=A0AAD7N6P9_9AGAR|nr:hypothetical protein DFH07DRAFT_587249 [Mycena maculata]